MKKLLTTTAIFFALSFSGSAMANAEWYGKESQDEKAAYMHEATSKLPAGKAAEFRNTMNDAAENNKELQQRLYALHGELHDILVAPSFDRNAFLAKRAELQQVHNTMEQNKTEAFASAMSDLSQNERVTLTRALRHEHNHHSKKHMKKSAEVNNTPSNDSNGAIKH